MHEDALKTGEGFEVLVTGRFSHQRGETVVDVTVIDRLVSGRHVCFTLNADEARELRSTIAHVGRQAAIEAAADGRS